MVIVLAFPVLIYLLILAGLSINVSALIALAALCALDWKFNFSAVMALMTPVILIGERPWAGSPPPRPPWPL